MPRVSVRLHGVFANFAGGARSATVDADTVGAALDIVASRYPSLRERLRDEHGKLREHMHVFANGEQIEYRGGESTTLADGDTVHIVPAMSGGS